MDRAHFVSVHMQSADVYCIVYAKRNLTDIDAVLCSDTQIKYLNREPSCLLVQYIIQALSI